MKFSLLWSHSHRLLPFPEAVWSIVLVEWQYICRRETCVTVTCPLDMVEASRPSDDDGISFLKNTSTVCSEASSSRVPDVPYSTKTASSEGELGTCST